MKFQFYRHKFGFEMENGRYTGTRSESLRDTYSQVLLFVCLFFCIMIISKFKEYVKTPNLLNFIHLKSCHNLILNLDIHLSIPVTMIVVVAGYEKEEIPLIWFFKVLNNPGQDLVDISTRHKPNINDYLSINMKTLLTPRCPSYYLYNT